jgi:hypothetical protein
MFEASLLAFFPLRRPSAAVVNIELYVPRKDSALQFLDAGKLPPQREALVYVFLNDSQHSPVVRQVTYTCIHFLHLLEVLWGVVGRWRRRSRTPQRRSGRGC